MTMDARPEGSNFSKVLEEFDLQSMDINTPVKIYEKSTTIRNKNKKLNEDL